MPTSGPLSKLPVPESTLREWAQCLMNPKASLVERSRALWGLRHAGEKLAVSLLSDFLTETEPSPVADTLLQHEAAYCLGQRGDSEAVPVLIATMRNPKHHPVVRHEAAEALAALCGAPGVDMDQVQKELLEFADGKVPELADTCQVGLGRIEWLRSSGGFLESDIGKEFFPFTIDPAPPMNLSIPGGADVQQMHDIMMDPKQDLFTRYQALFGLRDRILRAKLQQDDGELECCSHFLAKGLQAPGSDLLRHEVAFVLGQLALTETVPHLVECVRDASAHPMVRHEAFEALGAVIGQSEADECNADKPCVKMAREELKAGLNDPEPLVRESCVLALDIADYVSSPSQFQYAFVPS
ncbi:Deoxyhypusine hydroxylase [Fasciolopsis buskii]|uniref:Deoxyhypusine hydroxylase n=1 Tax=Fasciolopsis buskii TaxID=27845 RepID=A0A8E0RL93_9TREM|nr:Deoxyhypusine hydroxylase [Fasciolopsis buski]